MTLFSRPPAKWMFLGVAVIASALPLVTGMIGPLVPPGDTEFEYKTGADSASTAVISFRTGLKDVHALLELEIGPPALDYTFKAELDNHRPLAAVARQERGVWNVVLQDTARSLVTDSKFLWPSGRSVRLSVRAMPRDTSRSSARALQAVQPIVRDWRLYLTEQGGDTKDRATRRVLLTWTLFALTFVAILAAIIATFRQENARGSDSRAGTTDFLLGYLIDGVEGKDEKETKQLRTILHGIVRHSKSQEEAFAAAGLIFPVDDQGIAVPAPEHKKLWFKGKGLLLRRVSTVRAALSASEATLNAS